MGGRAGRKTRVSNGMFADSTREDCMMVDELLQKGLWRVEITHRVWVTDLAGRTCSENHLARRWAHMS